MKKYFGLVLLAVLVAEYAVFFTSPVQARDPSTDLWSQSRPYIRLYDANGHIRNPSEFVEGEKIEIKTYFPSPIYLVAVTDPNGKIRFWKIVISIKCKHYGVFDSGLLTGLTDKLGSWEVYAGILCIFKVRTFHVVPVAPLGVIGIFAACFAGLGTKYVKTRKNNGHNE
jgi:hypothetical protein